ncbi:MAG: PilZ domain-containing protein [Lysobacterales bacterium]
MKNARRHQRVATPPMMRVTDTITGKDAGRLGNLSPEGLMLVADGPIADGALHQFAFDLPDQYGRLQPVEVGVREVWKAPGTMHGQYWVGFRFISLGAADEGVLRDWLGGVEMRLG